MDKYDFLNKIEEVISECKYNLDSFEFEEFLCEIDDLVQYYSEDEEGE